MITELSATVTSISLSWSVASVQPVDGAEVMWRETGSTETRSTETEADGPRSSGVITSTNYTVVFNESGTYSVSVALVNAAGQGVPSVPLTYTVNISSESVIAQSLYSS